jgi:hypothetical protein
MAKFNAALVENIPVYSLLHTAPSLTVFARSCLWCVLSARGLPGLPKMNLPESF